MAAAPAGFRLGRYLKTQLSLSLGECWNAQVFLDSASSITKEQLCTHKALKKMEKEYLGQYDGCSFLPTVSPEPGLICLITGGLDTERKKKFPTQPGENNFNISITRKQWELLSYWKRLQTGCVCVTEREKEPLLNNVSHSSHCWRHFWHQMILCGGAELHPRTLSASQPSAHYRPESRSPSPHACDNHKSLQTMLSVPSK